MSKMPDPTLVADVGAYAAAVDGWCATRPPALAAAVRPIPDYATRVEVMSDLLGALFDAGWSRYGWPETLGGLGGSILHRGAMWQTLAAHGVASMAVFEHLEVLLPTLAALGPTDFVADALPAFLSGRERWAQGFSEPDAGSDLAALRTRAVLDGDAYRITGRKIWTSWAKYGTWCLVLARTGTTESRHRGLTAFVVDLRHPGVEVRAIEQANGTDELAEVTFDDVPVPATRIVGDLDGGWKVAMHILSHERGTYAWFRQCFMYRDLIGHVADGPAVSDRAVGDALCDIAAVAATSGEGLRLHASGATLGPRATITKLLLCEAERSIQDAVLAGNADLALAPLDDTTALLRQEYLFSRIVTVYGGSQQMQLETIAKQLLELP
ncbi:MAG: acyl-CoA dehydrogenase [Actinobacteria bacterium]|nr:acyl-CoA dehydrogenase [Actinomycetota bacterium]